MIQSSSDNLPEQPYALEHFHRLLQKHPLAFWGGLWAILMLVGTIATIGLFNPGSIEQEEQQKSTPAPTQIEESPEPKSPQEKDWSLPLFSAVVLGCAGGSLIVTHALKQSTQRHRLSKRSKSSAIVYQPKSLPAKRHRPPAQKKAPPVASVPPQPKSQPKIEQNIQPNTQPNISSNVDQTQVTVLSPEDDHPLDRKPESLAEMMDLRKHQSLKSLIRGNSKL